MKSSAPAQLEITRWYGLAAVFGLVSVISATVVVWLWMMMFALQWAALHAAPAAS